MRTRSNPLLFPHMVSAPSIEGADFLYILHKDLSRAPASVAPGILFILCISAKKFHILLYNILLDKSRIYGIILT